MFLNDFPTVDTSQPIQIGSGSISIPDFSFTDSGGQTQTVPGASSPSIPTLPLTTVQYTPQPVIPTLPQITVPMQPNPLTTMPPINFTAPTTTPPAVAPTAPTPAAQPAQSGDWFTRNVVPLVQAGLTTWAAVNAYNAASAQASARLPAGVSPSYLTAPPQQLSPTQLATMTPAQQQAYYAQLLNPTAYPTTAGGGIMQSLGLGSTDTSTLLLLGGGALLLFMLMRK